MIILFYLLVWHKSLGHELSQLFGLDIKLATGSRFIYVCMYVISSE